MRFAAVNFRSAERVTLRLLAPRQTLCTVLADLDLAISGTYISRALQPRKRRWMRFAAARWLGKLISLRAACPRQRACSFVATPFRFLHLKPAWRENDRVHALRRSLAAVGTWVLRRCCAVRFVAVSLPVSGHNPRSQLVIRLKLLKTRIVAGDVPVRDEPELSVCRGEATDVLGKLLWAAKLKRVKTRLV